MRISPNLSVVPVSADTTGSKAKAATAQPSGSSTVVTLSAGASSASASASASATSASSPDVATRLDRIKALLAKGDYPVDLDKLASRIVDDDGTRHGVGS